MSRSTCQRAGSKFTTRPRALQTLEGKLEETEAGLEEVADRTSVMGEHLRSVQSELAFTQQRLTSKAKEVQSEAHLRALGEREAARLDADARRLAKERGELRERVLGLQGQIYRANERMDQFRVRMLRRHAMPCGRVRAMAAARSC